MPEKNAICKCSLWCHVTNNGNKRLKITPDIGKKLENEIREKKLPY
jgi:hypothetical protein